MKAKRAPTVLIMAAGTGGHVFPAICIARELRRAGARIHWLGTRTGMENKLLQEERYPFHAIAAAGLAGSGLLQRLSAPSMLLRSLWQALRILRRVKPDFLLGMGGYVSGPGALAGRLLRIPVLIHEQNAVPGYSNQLISRWANRVFEAFPGTFTTGDRVEFTGNPVREEIVNVGRKRRYLPRKGSMRLLILGGSQGAQALNALIPELIATWPGKQPPEVLHQCGADMMSATMRCYHELGVGLDLAGARRLCHRDLRAPAFEPDVGLAGTHRLVGFIREIADAYAWADLVLCRSGAGTVAEIAACGLPAIFVPYPHHEDRQQLFNARWLAARQAAEIVEQSDLSVERLREILLRLDGNREWVAEMARRARDMAVTDAAQRVARSCLEVVDG